MSISTENENLSGDFCSALFDLALDSEEGDAPAGSPPEALFFVLPHLLLRELLILETVCRQLRDAIRGDVLLWQHLHVDSPLNKKIWGLQLMRLASRAQGRLQSLSLVKCRNVTDWALETVVASNPMLEKLSLPRCTMVSLEAVIRMVKKQTEGRSPEVPVFSQLHIRGLLGITTEILENLNSMMPQALNAGHKTPQFYKNDDRAFGIEKDRSIDVEVCPKCGMAKMVFDCTRPTCQLPLQQCKGCCSCIPRCVECGMCRDGREYKQTFCREKVCNSCWRQLPKCSECSLAGCSHHVEGLDVNGGFTCQTCQYNSPVYTKALYELRTSRRAITAVMIFADRFHPFESRCSRELEST